MLTVNVSGAADRFISCSIHTDQ